MKRLPFIRKRHLTVKLAKEYRRSEREVVLAAEMIVRAWRVSAVAAVIPLAVYNALALPTSFLLRAVADTALLLQHRKVSLVVSPSGQCGSRRSSSCSCAQHDEWYGRSIALWLHRTLPVYVVVAWF